MITTKRISRLLNSALLSITLLLVGANANAAACKGQAKSACSSASNCYWVDGYKRKDGVKVSAHCRSKAVKGKSSGSKKKKASANGKKNKAKNASSDSKSKSKKKTVKKVKPKKDKANKPKKNSKKKSSKKDSNKKQ